MTRAAAADPTVRRRRSVGALLAVLSTAVLTGLLITSAPGAAAGVTTSSSTPGSVMVSTDGITWSRSLPAGLFDGSLLVPGTPQNRTLYVRNDSSSSAILEIDAVDASSASAGFLDQLRLSVVSGSTASAIALTAAENCAPVTAGIVMEPGESLPLGLALELVDAAGEHHGSIATVQLHVLLREAGAASISACPTPAARQSFPFVGPAGLAATGSSSGPMQALAAGTAVVGIVGGVALMVGSRRVRPKSAARR
ncbi:hypothetical protein [Naasia lichenicola]|uniref:hypothetical protein n=1 Tax=Naasia lichenicola TaxID=2565933 RepID=UPI00130DC93F|nr:hypothetical protein [Naasia lichenicola]